MPDINEQIDRLIHDAQHADSGSNFAAMTCHPKPAQELREKCDRLKSDAERLYLENAGASWPDPEDCEWPAPLRTCVHCGVRFEGELHICAGDDSEPLPGGDGG